MESLPSNNSLIMVTYTDGDYIDRVQLKGLSKEEAAAEAIDDALVRHTLNGLEQVKDDQNYQLVQKEAEDCSRLRFLRRAKLHDKAARLWVILCEEFLSQPAKTFEVIAVDEVGNKENS